MTAPLWRLLAFATAALRVIGRICIDVASEIDDEADELRINPLEAVLKEIVQ